MAYTSSTKKSRHARRSSDENGAGFGKIAKHALIGSATSCLCALCLSFLASSLCMLFRDPASAVTPLGIAVCYVSASAGGFLCGGRLKSELGASLLGGFLCGVSFSVILGILSVIFKVPTSAYSSNMPTALSVVLRLLCVPCAVLGSYLKTEKSSKKRKRRR